MKESAILARIVNGEPIIFAEFRNSKGDIIRRKAPKPGEQATMPQAIHTVLVGDESFQVIEWLDDGADVTKVVDKYAKRARVAVKIESMERSKYGNRIAGEFVGEVEKG